MKLKATSLMFLFFSVFVFGQEWDYPVKPKTVAWKKLSSNREKVDVCQIPQEVLMKMNTYVLLKTCLNYPLIEDVYAFDDFEKGIDKLFKDFNGVRALFKREDTGDELLNLYSLTLNNQHLLDDDISDFEKGQYIVSISTLELLISCLVMKDKDTENLLDKLWEAYNLKRQKIKFFQGVGFRTNLFSRSKILFKNNQFDVEKINNETLKRLKERQ